MLQRRNRRLIIRTTTRRVNRSMRDVLYYGTVRRPTYHRHSKLNLVPRNDGNVGIQRLTGSRLRNILRSNKRPSIQDGGSSIRARPQPFLYFLRLFNIYVVLFIVSIVVIVCVMPRFTRASEIFSGGVFALMAYAGRLPCVLTISPAVLLKAAGETSFPNKGSTLLKRGSTLGARACANFRYGATTQYATNNRVNRKDEHSSATTTHPTGN